MVFLGEKEILYCQLLNETLDANQASVKLKCKNAISSLEWVTKKFN